MSVGDKRPWTVEVFLNHTKRTFTVGKVAEYEDTVPPYIEHYVMANAVDEISAFTEARRVLTRLGYSVGE